MNLSLILSIYDEYEISENELSYLLQQLEKPINPLTKPFINEIIIHNDEPYRIVTFHAITRAKGSKDDKIKSCITTGWCTSLKRVSKR